MLATGPSLSKKRVRINILNNHCYSLLSLTVTPEAQHVKKKKYTCSSTHLHVAFKAASFDTWHMDINKTHAKHYY